MTERLFGVETEYGLAAAGLDSTRPRLDDLAFQIMATVRDRHPHLLDTGARGLFLQNSSRLYVDCGHHPELAIGECANPWDVVRYILAGERLLADVAGALRRQRPDLHHLVFLKCNVDYSGAHTTWGCHESYLHRVEPALLTAIIPHLVTRIVYTGSGGFNPRSEGIAFTLSPRSFHLTKKISSESTSDRGLFHTKNESLCRGGYGRLHLLCGESLCSELAMWLKSATTALCVSMCEAGVLPVDTVSLRAPLEALRTIAGDPTCRARVHMTDGSEMTALDIQREFLTRAEAHVHDSFMPPWAEEACRRWREMLDLLDGAPDSVATTLDWAIKYALYVRRVWRHAFAWDSLPWWTEIANGLQTAECQTDRAGTAKWRGLEPFRRLRQELFEADLRFGQVGGDEAAGSESVFAQLDRAGVLTHHVPGVDNIAHAMTNPPALGRARLRGEAVKRFARARREYRCDWQAIIDVERKRVLDLSDPWETEERWRPEQ